MEAVLFIAVVGLGIFVLIQRSRMLRLYSRVDQLERAVTRLASTAEAPGALGKTEKIKKPAETARTDRIEPAELPVAAPAAVAAVAPPVTDRPGPSASAPVAARPISRPKEKSETWKRIERQIVENWTGIVGAIILTMGLGFLGLLAAISLSAVYRFLMLLGVFVALVALSYFLQKKPDWEKFSSWIRGTAGAVLLFACFGSAAVPGLRWIENQTAALVLVGAGVFVNLFFAYAARKQSFASLHLLLSLVTLAILPQELPVFILSSVVAFSGVVFAVRSRWEHQALLATSSFAVYQIYRYAVAGGSAADFSSVERGVGIASTAIVGATALLMHYRRAYAGDRLERMPFLSHLVHWFATALGFFLYSTGSKWNTIGLAAVAILCFLFARRARSLGIPWLYRTDTLVAYSIGLFAGLTLHRWEMGPFHIGAVLYIESLLFVAVMAFEKEPLLETTGRVLHSVIGIIVFLLALENLDYANTAGLVRNAMVLSVLLLASVLFEWRMQSRPLTKEASGFPLLRGDGPFSIAEGIVGLLLIALLATLIRNLWAGALAAALQILLGAIRHRQERNRPVAPAWGLAGFVIASHLMLWFHVFRGEAKDYGALSVFAILAPLFVSSTFLMVWPILSLPPFFRRMPGVALIALHLVATSLRMADPVTPLLPGTLWLLFSVLGLELGQWLSSRPSLPAPESEASSASTSSASLSNVSLLKETAHWVVLSAFGLTVLFLARHVLVELQTERYLGYVPVRALIETFAVSVFLYWFYAKQFEDRIPFFWRMIQPLFLEAAILMSVVGFEMEFTTKWMTVIFAIAPFVFFGVEQLLRRDSMEPGRTSGGNDLSRLRLYGLFFYWAAAFHIAFLSAVSEMPAAHWTDRSWVIGLASLLLLVAFVPWMYRAARFDQCQFPAALRLLTGAGVLLERRRNLWIFDPLFLAAALFLYWSFDKALLTLLWVALVFAIFSLSVLLRESHFRLIALIALAASLARLLLFDLSQSSTIMRAVVFVGVGLLMLAMNSLYNRFKDRFS